MSYKYKFGTEVYWLSPNGVKEHSQYFTDVEYAQGAIERCKAHNKMMGYAGWDVNYRIRPRIPITRKGSGRKKE